MKHITKTTEPAELLKWKSQDRKFQKGEPKWNRIPTPLKERIREDLRKEQGFICAYCERFLQENDYHMEHLKPKGLRQYTIFLADYDNLVCSCQFELKNGEPNHCGNSKGSWYDQTLFISPLDPGCETRFTYTFDGYIQPAIADDVAAITTINKLNLDIDKLNSLRQAAIEPFLDDSLSSQEVIDFVNGYLKDKSLNGGRYNEFYTTIKSLFSSFII